MFFSDRATRFSGMKGVEPGYSSPDEERRIAANIAKLPELLQKR
jgi:hypothetical protein